LDLGPDRQLIPLDHLILVARLQGQAPNRDRMLSVHRSPIPVRTSRRSPISLHN
jgi:hypothetical protein